MFKIFITISIVLFLSGCSRTVEYYEYSSEEVSIENRGFIRIGLLGEFEKDDSFFEKRTIKGNPYSVMISFVPNSGVTFCVKKLLLSQGEFEKEVKLVGDQCGKETHTKGFEPGTKLYSFEKATVELGKSVKVTIIGILGSDDQKEITVELASKHRAEERNDFLDRISSV